MPPDATVLNKFHIVVQTLQTVYSLEPSLLSTDTCITCLQCSPHANIHVAPLCNHGLVWSRSVMILLAIRVSPKLRCPSRLKCMPKQQLNNKNVIYISSMHSFIQTMSGRGVGLTDRYERRDGEARTDMRSGQMMERAPACRGHGSKSAI